MLVAARAIQAKPSVVCAKLDDEAVLLNVETGVYFGLDPAGNRIWELLIAGAGEDMIIETLLAEYEVEEQILRADVMACLKDLEANGLTNPASYEGAGYDR